jgi:hypothetical protein
MWWSPAQFQDSADAALNLQRLIEPMTKEQIAEAQEPAREWQEKHQSAGEE